MRARPRCTRHAVTADLTSDGWPAAPGAAGFRSEVPTAWLAEGLLPYLEPEAVEVLLRQVSALSAPGSHLAADLVPPALMAARNAYVAAESHRTGTPTSAVFRFGANDPAGLLSGHGWRGTAIKHPGDEECHFGRWLGPPPTGAGLSFAFAVRPAVAPSRRAGSTKDQRSATAYSREDVKARPRVPQRQTPGSPRYSPSRAGVSSRCGLLGVAQVRRGSAQRIDLSQSLSRGRFVAGIV